ncbi:MAG: NAD(P)H-hydrate epimerase, partial [Actinomycetota bacterium]|nr:NAD(P)H-hydrate epimerase [Actinomycetota bacterium]
MRTAHTADQVRAAEGRARAGLPDGTLMARAATGLATSCVRRLGRVRGRRVVLLVGSGDNGGDALYAGALLADRGARVEAWVIGSRAHEGGLAALQRAGGSVVRDPRGAPARRPADLVLDGIVGIGGRGGLRPDAVAVYERVAHGGGLVVAVDVPSGVDADTGAVAGQAVRADVTVTFGTFKPGLLVDPGADLAGEVELVDIGLEHVLPDPALEALEDVDVGDLLAVPGRASDKYRRGVVGVAAGSDTYPGAAVLCVGGALRTGAGMVRYVGPDAPTGLVRHAWPEAVHGVGRVQAWVVGSGLGEADEAAQRAGQALASELPAVVDADGLRHLRPGRPAPTLLTPHAGEL